jgi:hypothetical protein
MAREMGRKPRSPGILLAGCLSVAVIASGATITPTASQTQTVTDNWSYTISINNGGNVRAGGGSYTDTVTGDYTFDLSFSLPGGAVIDSAVLDLTSTAPAVSLDRSLDSYSGNFDLDYLPQGSAADVVSFLTITAGAVSYTVSGASVNDLDLLALGFGPALAGGNLQIEWRQVLTLTLDDSNWVHDKAHGDSSGTFLWAGAATTAAQASLALDYSEGSPLRGPLGPGGPESAPEPGALWLFSGGAAVLALAKLRPRFHR